MHEKAVIHRDLKTANILINNNIFKIADFGLAKQLNQPNDETNSILGTPYYMVFYIIYFYYIIKSPE